MNAEIRYVSPGSYFIVRPNGTRIGPYPRRLDAILALAGPNADERPPLRKPEAQRGAHAA
ncbi:hypothetical protein [Prosthecomicrobium pneumaticum]|uniref:Uncharacterized protein n=1 Tax=Prosthecomicrobium pneumaticum TaxID=81895 RepID=A0A7W9L3T6_9HYPH|nr:hypothetical protein [Prosthecomicrobium pneumaticum]MBB5754882.1 hypothetical protein [Prosthecomicrobium pneumaticum]